MQIPVTQRFVIRMAKGENDMEIKISGYVLLQIVCFIQIMGVFNLGNFFYHMKSAHKYFDIILLLVDLKLDTTLTSP